MAVTHTIPFSALLAGVFTRLGADGGTSALTFYQASGVPLDAAFPYGTVQVVTSADASTFTEDGRSVALAVQYVTRDEAGAGDDADAFSGLDAAVQALTKSALTVAGYDALRAPGPESADLVAEVDDGYVYRRATARLRFRLLKQ